MTDSVGLWSAVDSITQRGVSRLHRDEQAAAEWLEALANSDSTFCRVDDYHGVTATHGTTPCLWDQAVASIVSASEQTERGGVPLRERSPADLDLMETVHTIRETIRTELRARAVAPRETVPAQLRQLASELVRRDDELPLWTFKVQQWARLLATHLHALDAGPRWVRLRNSPCPECGVRQTRVVEQGERRLVPPILIDFKDGHIRAATCTECGYAWWRGDDLNDLADALGVRVLADPA